MFLFFCPQMWLIAICSHKWKLFNKNRAVRWFVAFEHHESQVLLVDSVLVHICGCCALTALWPCLNLFGVFVVLASGWSCETEKHVSWKRASHIFNEPIVGRKQRSHGSHPEALNSPVYEKKRKLRFRFRFCPSLKEHKIPQFVVQEVWTFGYAHFLLYFKELEAIICNSLPE